MSARFKTRSRRQAKRRINHRQLIGERLQVLRTWARPALLTAGLAVIVASSWQGYAWLMRPTTMPIRSVSLTGELRYVDPQRIKQVLSDDVNQGFFSIDLARIKQRVESLTWVYQVSLRRIWPDRLQVNIEEQRPIARWGGSALINRYGDIFEANPDVYGLELPTIAGPAERSDDLIKAFGAADVQLYPLGLKLVALTEDERGDQRLLLASGVQLALGRAQRKQRLQRFVASYRNTIKPMIDDVASFDLRYANGFAVKWKSGLMKAAEVAKGKSS